MIERGFTEREVFEEFSLETLAQFTAYISMKAKAEESSHRAARQKAKSR